MTILVIDGFDTCSNAADIALLGYDGSGPVNTTTGRIGGVALRMGSSNNLSNSKGLPGSAINSMSAGFAFRTDILSNFSTGQPLFRVLNGTTVVAAVGLTSTGRVMFGRTDFGGNLVGQSSAGVIILNTWHYIEFELVRATGTSGSVKVWVDGTKVIDEAATNTGASAIDKFGFVGGSSNADFDDFYFTDAATRLGEVRVETLRPSADTATKDFSRSTGSDNYANVDDTTQDGDSTYNFGATAGNKDLFDLGNLSSTPTSILAVCPIFTARKDDATTRELRFNMKNGSTTTNGTTRGMATTFQSFEADIYELNPDTAGAWSASDINSAQLGYEVVT